MCKRITLVAVSAILALSALASTANAQGRWHGGYYGPRPNYGAMAAGTIIGVAAANAINGGPMTYAPSRCGNVWDPYDRMWRSYCGSNSSPPAYYQPQDTYAGQRPLPSPCRGFVGNAIAGNGVPICD